MQSDSQLPSAPPGSAPCGGSDVASNLAKKKDGIIASTDGLGDALVILTNISKEYSKLCYVMMNMPERKSELKAGRRFMDALENIRDELLKPKSPNEKGQQ